MASCVIGNPDESLWRLIASFDREGRFERHDAGQAPSQEAEEPDETQQ